MKVTGSNLRKLARLTALTAAGAVLLVRPCGAQVRTNPPASPDPVTLSPAPMLTPTDSSDTAPITSVKPETRSGRVILEETKTDLAAPALRPVRPERPELPAEVSLKLREFQRLREEYLRQREEILKKSRGATDAEREKLRQELNERWQQYNTELRENVIKRQQELIDKFPDREKAIEAAREKSREQLRDIKESQNLRDRRRAID